MIQFQATLRKKIGADASFEFEVAWVLDFILFAVLTMHFYVIISQFMYLEHEYIKKFAQDFGVLFPSLIVGRTFKDLVYDEYTKWSTSPRGIVNQFTAQFIEFKSKHFSIVQLSSS